MIPQQETFDRSVVPVIKQGRPSKNSESCSCAYRGVDGTRCAAGWLLADEKYLVSMEGYTVRSDTGVGQVLAAEGHDLVLVSRLQNCHDNAEFDVELAKEGEECSLDSASGERVTSDEWVAAFVKGARLVASDFGLSTAALDEALAARTPSSELV